MKECAAGPPLVDCAILDDDLLFLDNPVIWPLQPQTTVQQQQQPQQQQQQPIKSYEALSSPESQFSCRSRASSGDEADTFSWRTASSPEDAGSWNPTEETMKLTSFLQPVLQHQPDNVQQTTSYLFDTTFSDLHTILETQLMPKEEILTPAATPEDQVEWTYLEPAQPLMNIPTSTNEQLGLPLDAAAAADAAADAADVQARSAWDVEPIGGPAVLVQPVWHHEDNLRPTLSPVSQHMKPMQLVQDIYVATRSEAPPPPPPVVIHQQTGRKSRSQRATDGPRQCHVCGEAAGKHSYYGGQVCPSCRAFFRRSVQSKYSDVYKCSKDGNCTVTLKTRKNCQFCRFNLCEKAGMKRSWVLADGERKKVPPTTSRQQSCSPMSSPVKAQADTGLSSDGFLQLSKEDIHTIQDCVDKMQMINHQTEDLNPQIMEEIVQMVKEKDAQMSASSRCDMKKVLEQRSRLFALNVPEFTSLSSSDQIILLDENMGPLIELRLATFFHTEINWKQQVGLILGQSDVTRLTSALTGMQDSVENQHLEYEQFFAKSEASVDWVNVESQHKSLLQKISKWVEDETTFCLMNLVMLCSTENSATLKAAEAVEKYQMHFAGLLHRYLLSRYPRHQARAKLAEGIRVISHCRELHQLAKYRCNKRKATLSGSSSGSSSDEQP